MDPNRFDSFAKKLGSRLSRRDMMRASAGAAVGAIAVSKFTSVAAQDADTTAKDRFISVRTYAYTGTEADAATGLAGLIAVMEQQPGFIEYNLVFGDGQILAISTFLDETTAVAAAQQEDSWISANAATILSGSPTIQSGDVFLRSELYAGCGDDRLVGGIGADHTEGGTGKDIYFVDETGDTVVEREGGGIDLANSSSSFNLAFGATRKAEPVSPITMRLTGSHSPAAKRPARAAVSSAPSRYWRTSPGVALGR